MKLGIDVSTYFETLEAGAKYYIDGKEVDPIEQFIRQGVDAFRIRLWIDPYAEDGTPYHGGTVDLKEFYRLADFALSRGFKILLDFHYSDFWCDPSKQMLPKSWRGLSYDEIVQKVYDYTVETLKDIKAHGIPLMAIQMGNEITNGMLWPHGRLHKIPGSEHRNNYEALIPIIKSGIKGIREIYPESLIILHLEKSGFRWIYEEWFGEMKKANVDYDVIGLSYYPYWHGTFDMLYDNVEYLKKEYGKPIWIVETGYGFTMAPFIEHGAHQQNLINEGFFEQDGVFKPYPLTKEGQRDFFHDLLASAEAHGIEYIMYWEPLWLPMPGLEWASYEGEVYAKETDKPTHNEWANQCLYDYEGNANPALYEFSIKK